MKAEEFRVGNFFYLYPGYTGRVIDSVRINDIGLCQMSIEVFGNGIFDLIEPIPLTEEWLKKSAFVTMDYEIDYIEWGIETHDDPNCERFHIIQDGIEEPFFFEYDLGFGNKRIEVKYVHQLQNLYFALTDEELKFEL